MEDAVQDPTLALSAGSFPGIIIEPLRGTGDVTRAIVRTRRTVKWPIHSFDFALIAVGGLIMAGAGVISVLSAIAP